MITGRTSTGVEERVASREHSETGERRGEKQRAAEG